MHCNSFGSIQLCATVCLEVFLLNRALLIKIMSVSRSQAIEGSSMEACLFLAWAELLQERIEILEQAQTRAQQLRDRVKLIDGALQSFGRRIENQRVAIEDLATRKCGMCLHHVERLGFRISKLARRVDQLQSKFEQFELIHGSL